jgi:hypothetical protein
MERYRSLLPMDILLREIRRTAKDLLGAEYLTVLGALSKEVIEIESVLYCLRQ